MAAEGDQNILARFTEEQGLVDVLHEIGVGDNERDRIVDDGFRSMRTLVEQYERDVEGLAAYLKQMNKAFGAIALAANRVYFSPPTVSKFLGLLHYCNVAYYSYHVIPDVGEVTAQTAMEYYKIWKSLSDEKAQEEDKEVELNIPSFKGASNWRSFRKQVEMRLS